MFEREINPTKTRKAEIVVGLASYNEADSIAYPVQQAALGLTKYYGKRPSVILDCDNNSPDNTRDAFLQTDTAVPKIYVSTPKGVTGKGYNLENMFRKTLALDADILVCLDADLTSVSPEWIKWFVDPIASGFDFVNPIYSRHKYDGTITKNICFPLIYGLFCRHIRQPIGGDFALSKRLIQYLVCQPWHRTTEEYGIDIFMTMNAVLGGFKICETGLGAKHHKPSAPKLGPMFVQVVSTAFVTVLQNAHKWKKALAVEQPPLFGLRQMDPAQELKVKRSAIEKQARDGFAKCQGELEKILSPPVYGPLAKMFSGGTIDVSAEQWAVVVYDMIAAFQDAHEHAAILEAFKGLYFGRVLSFMNQTWEDSTEKAEEAILAQAKIFYATRDYLIGKLE